MNIGTTDPSLLVAGGGTPVTTVVLPRPEVAGPAGGYCAVKRGIDVMLALVALLITLPLWPIVALAVRASSDGPVYFRQRRIGRNGRPFTVLKFRSMRSDAEALLSDLGMYEAYVAGGFKLPAADERRVTRVGRFLRRSSIDELPQLFNVLRGDMSMVGPRPVLPEELSSYGDLTGSYLRVRPGITGMWQVNGRSDVVFPERAHMDHDYFQRRSLRLDLEILLRTPLAVLRGDGAY